MWRDYLGFLAFLAQDLSPYYYWRARHAWKGDR